MSYNLDLNKLDKPYSDAYMSQISSKSVQRFESSRKTKKVHADNNDDNDADGHRVIARVTLTR